MTMHAEQLNEWVTLYHADCMDVLPTLQPGYDLLTDPPYGISEAAGKNKSRAVLATSRDYGNSDWDNTTADNAIELAVLNARNAIVFGGNYYKLPPSSCWLVWDKLNGATDFADCELAWTNLPKAVRRLCHRWHGMIREGNEERVHPTQKPLKVMQWAINHLPTSIRTILDPFAGSGTTAIAAMLTGRKCILIERDARYCEVIRKRVREADAASPGKLFAPANDNSLFAEVAHA